jgi:type I restriction enzyme R subunit
VSPKRAKGVDEHIYRTGSGDDLISALNSKEEWLIGSLVHKFGRQGDAGEEKAMETYLADLKKALPSDFEAKGEIFVFVDECHRTQSGKLHEAMKAILPNASFIGFTGTPLLRTDKQTTMEVFGTFIDEYRFDEAIEDKVVLDLHYDPRDIDQTLSSQSKVDVWFDAHTSALTASAKAQVMLKWATMQKLLSSQDRLAKIVQDITMDMIQKPRLMSGCGNAMLVCSSIYDACKVYELAQNSVELKGRCAVITSYVPQPTTPVAGATKRSGHDHPALYLVADPHPESIYSGRAVHCLSAKVQQAAVLKNDELFHTQAYAGL